MSAVLKDEQSVAWTASMRAASMVDHWAESMVPPTVELLDWCLASLRAARTESMSAVLTGEHSVASTVPLTAASMVERWAESKAQLTVALLD